MYIDNYFVSLRHNITTTKMIMKRNLIIAFCVLAGITIHAQDVMVVEMNDNTTHEFTIADVRQIYFKTSGETSTSIEGTWYMKSLKGYYYYPADERYEPHNSSYIT